jgi:hypothetical protein
MICGWQFMISNQVVNSDSNYKFMKSMLDGLNDKDLFCIFFPYSKNSSYVPDGLFDQENILPIIYKAPSQKILQSTHFDSEFIFKQVHQYGINVIFNNVIETSPQLHQIFNTFRATKLPMIVGYPHYTLHPSISYPMHAYPGLRLMGLLGNYMSDIVMYNSEYHYSMFEDNMREFQLEAWLPEIEAKKHNVPIPVLDKEMQPFYDECPEFTPNHDNILFYYNHRLQNYKLWKTTFDLWNNLWNNGYQNFGVQMSYGSGDNSVDASAYPFVKLNKTHKHSDYYKKLLQPHFNTMNTVHETFCISILESGLLNGIPIIPKRVTFPELFPKDYPFFFHDDNEQKELVKNVLTEPNPGDAYSETKHQLREHLSQYNIDRIGKLADDIIKEEFNARSKFLYEHLKPETKRRWLNFCSKWAGREVPLKQLHTEAKKMTGQGNQSLPPYIFTTLLEQINHKKRFNNKQVYITIE